MKILFIDPLGAGKGFNWGIASLAAYLKQFGHEIKVLDINNNRENIEQRIDSHLDWNPDFIGISVVFTFNKPRIMDLVKYCKSKKNIPIVLGGPGATIDYEDLLRKSEGNTDFVVIGEAEETLLEFISRLGEKKDFSDMDGIAYMKGSDVIKNNFREFIKDIDVLPFPDYTDFDTFKGGIEEYVIITSRGCPYDCVFCANKTISRRRFRTRSSRNVIDELKYARDFYKAKTILIGDDNYTLDMKRAKEISRMMIEEDVMIPYEMYDGIRADKVDYELAMLLKLSGCKEVSLGVENADAETFKYVQKGETLKDIENAVKILKKVGIPTRAFVIIGLINTSKESDMRSLRFIEKLGVLANWNIAIHYPGMQLYDWVMKNGRILISEISLENQLVKNPPFVFWDTEAYPAKDRIFMYKLANLRTKNYFFIYGQNKNVSWINKFFQIMKISWEVDRARMPIHAFNFWYNLYAAYTKKRERNRRIIMTPELKKHLLRKIDELKVQTETMKPQLVIASS